MSKEMVGEWLRAYGAKDFKGRISFDYQHDMEFAVELSTDERFLTVSAVVDTFSGQPDPAYLAGALRMNYLGIETRGATLSIDATGSHLVLWYSRPVAALGPEGFDNLVGSFLDVSSRIHEKLSQAREMPRASAVAPPVEEAAPAGTKAPSMAQMRV